MSNDEKDMIEAVERLKKALGSSVAAALGSEGLKDYLASQGDLGFTLQVVPDAAIRDSRITRAEKIIFPWEGDPVAKSLKVECARCGYMNDEKAACNCTQATKMNWFED
jgi:hypothetical protein